MTVTNTLMCETPFFCLVLCAEWEKWLNRLTWIKKGGKGNFRQGNSMDKGSGVWKGLMGVPWGKESDMSRTLARRRHGKSCCWRGGQGVVGEGK